MSDITEATVVELVGASDPDVAHRAFELALLTDEPLVLFRRKGWLRWEATLWQAERVETMSAVYVYAKLRRIAVGGSRRAAQRALLTR